MTHALGISDRLSAVEQMVRSAPSPLKAAAIESKFKRPPKATKEEVASALEELTTKGAIYLWPPVRGAKRYWGQEPDAYLQQQLETAARQLARKPNELASIARKKCFGLPADRAQKAIQRLTREGILKAYPVLEGGRGQLLAHRDAAEAYLGALDAPFRKMLSKLEAAHYTREQVLEHLTQSFGGASRPDAQELLLSVLRATSKHPGVPVSVHRVRTSPLLRELSKTEFDHAALSLFAGRRILLSRHDDALGLPPEERDDLITDGRELFYVGICER